MTVSSTASLVRLGQQLRDALPPGVQRDEVDRIAATAHQPVRIAVVGRVSTGKSTLVNALLGRTIAATAAEDCTRYPTVYSYGAPEQALAVGEDGTRTPLPLEIARSEPPPGTARFEVSLQTEVLRRITLLDSPGLAGTATASGAARAPGLIRDYEILLYLFRGELRTDDTWVLDDHAEATRALTEGALPTVGVLAHADNFGDGGWGDDDPLERARLSCAERLAQAAGRFHQVVPVSALMAETVRTGGLTESDSRRLRRLRDVDPMLLRFGAGAPDDDPTVLDDLTAKLTGYGLNHGRAHAGSTHELSEWMLRRSGFDGLLASFDGLRPMVEHLRLARALRSFEDVLADPGTPIEARALLEQEVLGPAGHVARELRAYRLLAAEQPDHASVMFLRDLLSRSTAEERLEIVRVKDPDSPDPVATCFRAAGRFQSMSGLGGSSVEREAARVLSMSMFYLGESFRRGTAVR